MDLSYLMDVGDDNLFRWREGLGTDDVLWAGVPVGHGGDGWMGVDGDERDGAGRARRRG